jgi:hypothetical protein
VAIVGRDIYWRGVRLPRTALRIEYSSQVDRGAAGPFIEVIGPLRVEPSTGPGLFLSYQVLRRPRHLGSIRYLLRPLSADPSSVASFAGAATPVTWRGA